MRSLLLAALIAFAAACHNGDCAQSSDIQVNVAPNDDVTIGDIVRLHVMLSVADGPVRTLDIDTTPPNPSVATSGSAFILRPDTTPANSYNVSLTVQAYDAAGSLIAIGSESMQAVIKGCNRLTVHLAALPAGPEGPVDMAIPPGGPLDMTGVLPPDLAGCIGGTPDEDADGRANACDACPADSDPSPVDTDADGLPDACDPDPAAKSNMQLYFEPFDNANPHWSGDNPVQQSFVTLDPGMAGVSLSANATDMLPLNVRFESYIFPTSFYGGSNSVSIGLYLGTNPNPVAPGATGVLCRMNSSNNKLEIIQINNGTLMAPTSQSLPFSGDLWRLRLTQRANAWWCEATLPPNTDVTVTTTQTVTAPLYMAMRSDSMVVHTHSVVVESALPTGSGP